jgi:hypothetical protein
MDGSVVQSGKRILRGEAHARTRSLDSHIVD